MNGALKQSVKEPPGPARAIQLTSDLVIGNKSINWLFLFY